MEQNQELPGSVTTLGEDINEPEDVSVSLPAIDAQLDVLRNQLNVLLDMHSRESSTDVIDRINEVSAAITQLQELREIQEPPPHLPSTSSEESNDMVASIAAREEIQASPSLPGTSSEESNMGFSNDEMSSLEDSL
jgi:hypothetical protein